MRLTKEQASTLAWWLDRRRQELAAEWMLSRLLGELAATLRAGGHVIVEEQPSAVRQFLWDKMGEQP